MGQGWPKPGKKGGLGRELSVFTLTHEKTQECTADQGKSVQPKAQSFLGTMWGFLKLGIPCWEVPIIRIIVVWGLYSGPFVLGKLPSRQGAKGGLHQLCSETQSRP